MKKLLVISLVIAAMSASAIMRPGLKGGFVNESSGQWLTVTPEKTQAYSGPHAATNRVTGISTVVACPPIWGCYRTWVYTGQMFLEKGTHWFCKYNYGSCYLAINGTQYISNTSGNSFIISNSYTVNEDEGKWVDIEIRLYISTGNAGPYSTTATGTDANGILCGFGHAIATKKPGTSMANFTYPCDPGDGSVFRHDDGRGHSDSLEIDCEPVRFRVQINPGYSLTDYDATQSGLNIGDEVAVSAPASVAFGDHLVATCTGWKLSYWSDAVNDYVFDASAPNAQGSGTSFTYVHQGVAARLAWQWTFTHNVADATATLYVRDGGAGARDGSSWANAFPSLEDAVAAASTTSTNVIIVGPGLYACSADSNISKPVYVLGIDKRDGTQATLDGLDKYRTIYLNHASAVVDNLRLHRGHASGSSNPSHYGGGVRISSAGGLVKNCFLNKCWSESEKQGGSVGIEGGTLSRCTVTGGYTLNGNGNGSGAYVNGANAVVENCLFYGNSQKGRQGATTKIGAVYLAKGIVRNCTIVKNYMGKAGGIYVAQGGVFVDSIVYGNETGDDTSVGAPNWRMADGAFVTNICTPVAMGVVTPSTRNLTLYPGFADFQNGDYTLALGSPCIDAASGPASSAYDLAGNPRVQGAGMDIGAYESDPSTPAAGFSYTVDGTCDSATLSLTAVTSGIDPSGASFYWSYDGRVPTPSDYDGSGASVTTQIGPGIHSVCLAVYSGNDAYVSLQRDIVKIYGSHFRVRAGNENAKQPYSNWENAAPDLKTVLALSRDGTEILVTNGTYTVAEQMQLFDTVAIRSVEGPEKTVFTRGGNTDFRLFWINSPGVLLSGITISNGKANAGAGAYMLSGTISNCIVKSCVSTGNSSGGGLYLTGGLVIDSRIIGNNTIDNGNNHGAGIYATGTSAIIDRCVITNNYNIRETNPMGGGVALYGGAICRNSLIANNRAPKAGGVIVNNGRLENCTVVSNYTNKALGTSGGIHCNSANANVVNCVIYDNYSTVETLLDALQNTSGTASCFMTNAVPVAFGVGDITKDPLFIDRFAGDYHFKTASPCINAGDISAYTGALDDLDVDHNRRFFGRRPDLGCYECQKSPATAIYLK